MKEAFLEKINGEWLDDFVYISKQPLIDMGYNIVPYDGDDLENTLVMRNPDPNTDICIGSVQGTVKFFQACGVDTPKYIGYPDQLKKYLGRKIEETTFGNLGRDFPYFVKPSNEVKMFTGDIVSNDRHLEYLVSFDGCKEQTPVIKSEVVEFITEYRAFVSYGKIYGIKHYKGDFLKFIDASVLDKMVDDFTDCPSAFTLDIGLTEDGRTLLVEVNDMWAIGSYGMDGREYALLCARRMKEILRSNNFQ
jgi:hypothetical protein